jgi:hypothetical protein
MSNDGRETSYKESTMKTTMTRLAAVAATGLLLSIGGIALAQPAFGHGHGPGPGAGMDVERLLAGLQAQLNLTTLQQGMWTTAVQASTTARETGRANMQKLHDAFAAQLANTTPDLAALALAAEGVQADNQTLRHAARDAWLKLYATFSADQVAVVRAALQQHLAKMDSMRARMLQHMQKNGG